MNAYNYNHLYYFYVTAKLKGVTVAAKYLNTSQSSLSTQIKTLESALKRSLFKKSGRKIELTDSGREIYSYCRRAFDVFDEMFDQVEKKDTSMGIRISVGVSTDIERPFVSESLAKISKQYPKGSRPRLKLISLPSSQLMQLLKLGELDVVLTTGGGQDGDIAIEAEYELPVGLFAHSDLLPLFRGKSIEKALSKGEIPVVLPSEKTDLRFEIDQYLTRKKLSPDCLFESNIISAVVRSASDGLGATILPDAYVIREMKSDRLVRVDDKPLWQHKIYVVANKGKVSSEMRSFVQKLSIYFYDNLGVRVKGSRGVLS